MRKRWVWALVLALVLQGLAFAACAEEETVEPETAEPFALRDGFTWQTTQEELLAEILVELKKQNGEKTA